MIRWVVTGPIAAGKSSVTEYLVGKGAAVVNADHLGHEILDRREVIQEIIAAFSHDVISNGLVDRKILGAIVFADSGAMEKLNRITHGRISEVARQRLDELEERGEHQLAVLEAAMFFFFPDPPEVDLTITVTADKEIRSQRLADSRGLDPYQVSLVFKAQQKLEEFCARADVLLRNEGSPRDLQASINQLLEREQIDLESP